jgi:hypothetical protein
VHLVIEIAGAKESKILMWSNAAWGAFSYLHSTGKSILGALKLKGILKAHWKILDTAMVNVEKRRSPK